MLSCFYENLRHVLISNLIHFKNQFLIFKNRSYERHLLSRMSQKELWDIGISLSDAKKEINKEFWQP